MWTHRTLLLTKWHIHVISVHKHATVHHLFPPKPSWIRRELKQANRGGLYFEKGMFSMINRLKTAKLQISGKEFSLYIFYCVVISRYFVSIPIRVFISREEMSQFSEASQCILTALLPSRLLTAILFFSMQIRRNTTTADNKYEGGGWR